MSNRLAIEFYKPHSEDFFLSLIKFLRVLQQLLNKYLLHRHKYRRYLFQEDRILHFAQVSSPRDCQYQETSSILLLIDYFLSSSFYSASNGTLLAGQARRCPGIVSFDAEYCKYESARFGLDGYGGEGVEVVTTISGLRMLRHPGYACW